MLVPFEDDLSYSGEVGLEDCGLTFYSFRAMADANIDRLASIMDIVRK